MTAEVSSALDRQDGRLLNLIATLVLAWTTGTPVRSVPNFLPHAGGQAGPYLGV